MSRSTAPSGSRSPTVAPAARAFVRARRDPRSTDALQGPAGRADVAAPGRLSPRQHEVLELLAEGVRARDIGLRLGLSEATVRNHIRAVLRSLGCHSQLQAVARARERHLV